MKNYLSLVKFSHTVFALPFAMIGFTLGVFQATKLEVLLEPVLIKKLDLN
jgi:4-hydroxybenzoate polyprenyltransferase